jgi:hypoxanthine phosphoribosyltransferase
MPPALLSRPTAVRSASRSPFFLILQAEPCDRLREKIIYRLMNKPVLAVTYEHLDQWIASLQTELTREGFACTVGILRGGAVLALMVSHATGVASAFLRYDRASRAVTWDSSIPIPPDGSKVLICEDIAGLGNTLADSIEFLKSHGLIVKTMTAGFDDSSRIRPDYGIDGRGYFLLFPWERHSYTDEYRAAWQGTDAGRNGRIAEDHKFLAYAIDLDGILLPDIPPERYEFDLHAALRERDNMEPHQVLPPIDIRAAKAIITGRPEMDRTRTATWLRKYDFDKPLLLMRDPAKHDDTAEQVAVHKAEAAVHLACTHFIESDPRQAILIARHAPLLRVVWWDALTKKGKLISAHDWQTDFRTEV